MRNSVGTLFAFLFLLVCGCRRESIQSHAGFWPGARSEDVIFSVNGLDYRISDFEDDVSLNVCFLRHRAQGSKLPENVEGRVRQRWLQQFVPIELSNLLLLSDATMKDFEPDAQKVQEVKVAFARAYGLQGETFEAVRTKAREAGLEAAFDRKLDIEVKVVSFFSESRFPDLSVSGKDVEKYIEYCQELLKRGREGNAKAKALADEICRRAKAGEDFAKMAESHSQMPGVSKEALGAPVEVDEDDFKLDQMEDVWQRLWALKVGEVLGPINTEATGGWMIYKVVERVEKGALTGRPALKVVRILLREIAELTIPGREEARQRLRDISMKKVQGEAYQKMKSAAKIVFPHGFAFMSKEGQEALLREFPQLSQHAKDE